MPGKELQYPPKTKPYGAQRWSGHFGEEKKLFASTGN
jgi:hypothetical protein